MSHEINYPHTCNVFFFLIQNEKKEERHPIRQTVDCKPDIIYRFIDSLPSSEMEVTTECYVASSNRENTLDDKL